MDQSNMTILVGLISAAGSWLLKAVFDRVFGRNKDMDDLKAEQRLQSERIARIEAEAEKNEALFRQDIHQIRDKMQEWFIRLGEQLKELKQEINGTKTVHRTPNRKTS